MPCIIPLSISTRYYAQKIYAYYKILVTTCNCLTISAQASISSEFRIKSNNRCFPPELEYSTPLSRSCGEEVSTEQRLQGCIDRCTKGTGGGRKQTVKQEAMAMCQLKEHSMASRSRLSRRSDEGARSRNTALCLCAISVDVIV